MNKKAAAATVILFAILGLKAQALELWRNPECAEENTLFIEGRFVGVSVDDGFLVYLPELGIDWMLPVPLPLSAGVFMATPEPNLKSFGARAGWHIDLRNEKTDLYVLYVFELGWLRNETLEEHGDTPVEKRFYDFRVGVRRVFGNRFCLMLETAYKLSGINAGVSIRF